MPEKDVEQREEEQTVTPTPETPARKRRRIFTRNRIIAAGLAVILGVILFGLFATYFFRGGVADSYIKGQFVSRMAEMGIDFNADVFRLDYSPLALELKNATFNDRLTGEKLFFIRDARLTLTVQDLYAWQLSRDISIDTTDISGAEVWVRFDENGRSNFSNLKLIEDEAGSRVNFKYESMKFSLRDSAVHFADRSRKIDADANNLVFLFSPQDITVTDEDKRYDFDLTSTRSRFAYDGRDMEPVDLRVRGVADKTGADITEFRMDSPLGSTNMAGRIDDWAALKYDLNIESSVDLTKGASIFQPAAAIKGIGNFKGKVSGEGENYHVDGNVASESLTAEGVYLRGVNVNATIDGTNSSYTANGNAIAELLTFGDFRIQFPKIAGNVRGTGTDFRWVGELQAAAASSKSLTLGGLFLSDAVAEMKDREFTANAGTARIQKFSVAEVEMADVLARDMRITMPGGDPNIAARSVTAGSFRSGDVRLGGLSGNSLKVKNSGGRTDVDLAGIRSKNAKLGSNDVQGLTAKRLRVTDTPGSTAIVAEDLRADRVLADGTRIDGVSSPELKIDTAGGETIIYSDRVRVAGVTNNSAVLGSLNIGGVRLTIRDGYIRGNSQDINVGDVKLARSSSSPEGGTLSDVKVRRPVFVLEPSGRYRVTADMSIGGGTVGSIPLGNAQAKVVVTNNGADLSDLNARIMDGSVTGTVKIASNSRSRSLVRADLSDLDLSKLLALQSGRIIPLEGRASGRVDLTFLGTDFRTTSGTVDATVTASAGRDGLERIPVNGEVKLVATNGLFNVDVARFNTDKTELTASGRFDLRSNDSDLAVHLRSEDASEIVNLMRVTEVSPALESQIDSMQIALAGRAEFDGRITGNFSDPTIDGNATVASLQMRGRDLGKLSSDIFISPDERVFRNGRLEQADGGVVAFDARIPILGTNNIEVNARMDGVNAGNLLAALPFELPERLNDFNGKTTGTVALTGLPHAAAGEINISSESGTIAGQNFDRLNAKAVFRGSRVDIETAEIRVGEGQLSATGFYDMSSTAFDLDLTGKQVPMPLVLALVPSNSSIPTVTGSTDVTAKAVGIFNDPSNTTITFDGVGRDIVVNDRAVGAVTYRGQTVGKILNANLVATLEGRPQEINATLNFGDERLPLRVRTTFDNSPLGPFFAFIPQLQAISIEGTGTGEIEFGGNIASRDANGNIVYSADSLTGFARFSSLALRIQDTPINSVEPVSIRFDTKEIVFESAKFSGSGSDLTIAGTKALRENGVNSLSIDGRLNLSLLNVIPQIAGGDNFFGGLADVSMRMVGPNSTARLSGTANLQNASFATFVGSDRLMFDRLKGTIRFSANQVQVDQVTGYLGGGEFVASGGALLANDLSLDSFRFDLNGNNVTVPLPQDFVTTGDARLEVSGRRVGSGLSTQITGRINARRSVYTEDIDLASVVGARRQGSLSSGPSAIRAPRFDLTIEGRDALVVRNNIADLTASVSLRLTGTTDDPQITGRITANSGTVFFRKDRYIVQRGVLEFPPNTEIEPVINLQAESEINGYQVFVNLSGPLTDTQNLVASVRSSPALPQADVISLITTGSLSNTEGGIPTLAQTGINTAAEVIADSIINNPARRATDRLFGLNVFEIDPIISGQRLNPGARLTVGRQINNNLRVTYATNLSQDQNQVLALEYRVSNKLSFVAQYEQRSLTNVTQNRNNFSFEVRFRKRF